MLQWEKLPEVMQTEPVREYYEILSKKKVSLFLKRAFDIVCSLLLLLLLFPVMLVLALWIKADSRGPVLFRQERVTRYGRRFRIFKFRTMIPNAFVFFFSLIVHPPSWFLCVCSEGPAAHRCPCPPAAAGLPFGSSLCSLSWPVRHLPWIPAGW